MKIDYLPYKEPEYTDTLMEMYPDKFKNINEIKTLTFQVTEDCCLQCKYCYQVHNSNSKMDFDTIEPFLNNLLHDKYDFFNTSNTKGIILEFIGGEPFLEIELINKICDYVYFNMINLNHPWLNFLKISISSNGLLYFQPKVQDFMLKYSTLISLGISIDGNKELHDSCRIDLNGKGSYDRAIAAVRDYKKTFGQMPGIKMTFSPENVSYIYDSYISVINEGYTQLNGNCVFEEGWNYSHATILYNQLKRLADYLIENNLYNKIYVSFFDENSFTPMDETDNGNWCGGTNTNNFESSMYALDSSGDIYNCIRYMKSALQNKQKPLPIGDINHGVGKENEHISNLKLFNNITRRSQSTDECFYCPIAKGCAWCSAHNYQCFGSVNKRATYICPMHKARALANVYYWNRLYMYLGINKTFKNNMLDSESLKIVSKDELDFLNNLETSKKGDN